MLIFCLPKSEVKKQVGKGADFPNMKTSVLCPISWARSVTEGISRVGQGFGQAMHTNPGTCSQQWDTEL